MLPHVVYRAKTMTLRWHGADGLPVVEEILHAADLYYGGPWYDAVMAQHQVPLTGGQRRLPSERLYVCLA